MPARKRIALLAFDQALITSLSLPMELFNAADQQLQLRHKRSYVSVEMIGSHSPCRFSGNLQVDIEQQLDNGQHYELIFIPSRWRHPQRSCTAEIQQWLVKHAMAGSQICAVGNGSYLLAEAGLLDYRPATTHWHYFDDFAKRYPRVLLQRDYLMTESQNFYCTGSVNSAADLSLYLIEKHWGKTIAQRVTQQFSPESRRPFSRHGFHDAQSAHGDELIALCQSYMLSHLGEHISISELARAHDLSLRSFQRRFKHVTGLSPQQYIHRLRLETAEELLRNSNLSISDIGHHCGFNDASYFGRQFRDYYQASPGAYRVAVRKKLFDAEQD